MTARRNPNKRRNNRVVSFRNKRKTNSKSHSYSNSTSNSNSNAHSSSNNNNSTPHIKKNSKFAPNKWKTNNNNNNKHSNNKNKHNKNRNASKYPYHSKNRANQPPKQKPLPIVQTPSNVSQFSEFTKFQGSALFRYRLLLATLTHKPICIDNIRISGDTSNANDNEDNSNERNDTDDSNHNNNNNNNNSSAASAKPGLKDYELSFLQMLDKITNGSLIEINETGTRIRYRPGTLIGSESVVFFHCCNSRSIVYWLEPMLILLMFAKSVQTSVTFYGSTYHKNDISVDVVRSVLIPLLIKQFQVQNIKIDIRRRSLSPAFHSGEVRITVPNVNHLKTIDMLEVGMIKKIRGLCYTISMAPTIANRVRLASNEVLYNHLNDVWIFNHKTTRLDLQKHVKNQEMKERITAGYGLTLIAESTNNVLLSVHQIANANANGKNLQTAEEFGEYVAKLLLKEIAFGGTIDTSLQSTIVLLMALCTEDVSRVRLGRITQQTVHTLRLIRDLLGVTFRIKEDPETGTIFASCMGIGYRNIWRQAS